MNALYGIFSAIPLSVDILIVVAAALGLGYFGLPLLVWTVSTFLLLWLLGVPKVLILVLTVPMAICCIPILRRQLVSANVMKTLKALKILPNISETEKIALEAGHTWADAELFSGNPNINKLMHEPYSKLSEKEQSFVDKQCQQVCRMMDDQKAYEDGDLPKEVWDYLRKERFFGLVIPEEYGGLGFSGLGHSEVVSMLGTRSIPLAISVMVPNSLGPAELLVHYGTDEQKKHYLPRLASGEEIPCFGFTEPQAGSDAGSMTSHGVVFKDDDGKLMVRLSWRKRYITLGAVSTVIGLAAKLSDPENLLGRGKNLGITCFLIPSNAKGVVLGKRHDPLGVPFFNSPIEGNDVVISVDQIIGGQQGAGHGWKMLMECLASGRSISLPGQSTGGAKRTTRIIGAYAQVRQQFGLPICKFEGIEEALAHIGGMTYLLEACRVYTVGAVDKGLKPSVISAIAKYQSTEISRKIINDAMDVSGGSGISQGPRNLLANSYIAAPIGITVEGANILTRTMIVFGQGAIRCHPYAYKEVVALQDGDVSGFDKAFMGHVGHVVKNGCRALVLSLTRGRVAKVPSGPMAPYYRKLAWSSASFAFFADVAMGTLGGSLKLREKITGRYADILSWMYLITAVLRRYEAEGRQKGHEAFVHYSVDYGFKQIQEAFDGIFANLNLPVLGWLLKYPVAFWSRINSFGDKPSDKVGAAIAKAITRPGELRDAITERAVYIPKEPQDAFGRLEHAFALSVESQAIFNKISKASKEGTLPKAKPHKLVEEAKEKGVITREEAEILQLAKDACQEAIEVDSFKLEEYKKGVAHLVADEAAREDKEEALASNA